MSFTGSAESQAEILVTVAHHLRVGKYIQLAGFVILIYDHVLTFPRELERIWRQKITGATLLFLLNRYITPLQYIVIITAFHLPTWTGKACDGFVRFEGALSGAMSSICQAVMILRVYALYMRSNGILLFLSSLWIGHILITGKGVSTGVAVRLPPGPAFVGCVLTSSSNWLSAVWVSPLVIDSLIFFLTLWRTRQYLKLNERIPVLNIFVRDGIMYFFVICFMNLANALLFFLAPESLKPVLAPFSAMMTAVMISRLILNLRSTADAPRPTNPISPIHISPQHKETVILDTIISTAIGNLGEDFETSSERVSTSSHDHEDWDTRSQPSAFPV